MENNKEYSHENYRELFKEARVYDGYSNCYFCPDCRRYVPKKESGDPCPYCSNTNWSLDNPLKQQIINTKPLKQYMFETFRGCIEPFTTFEKQEWKNGNFFYRKDETKRSIKDTSDSFTKDVELWCVSHRGFSGHSLSLCVRWTEIHIYSDGRRSEDQYLRYITLNTPELFYDYNQEKDDEFYFNLIFQDLIPSRFNITLLDFKAINEEKEEYEAYAWATTCCESMTLYPDKLVGSLYHNQLLRGDLSALATALDDFTLICRYWGCEN